MPVNHHFTRLPPKKSPWFLFLPVCSHRSAWEDAWDSSPCMQHLTPPPNRKAALMLGLDEEVRPFEKLVSKSSQGGDCIVLQQHLLFYELWSFLSNTPPKKNIYQSLLHVSCELKAQEPNWPSFCWLLVTLVAYFNVGFVNAIAGCDDSVIVFVEVDFHPHHHLCLSSQGQGKRWKWDVVADQRNLIISCHLGRTHRKIASVRCQHVVRLVGADTRVSSAVTSIQPLVSKTAFANVIVHPLGPSVKGGGGKNNKCLNAQQATKVFFLGVFFWQNAHFKSGAVCLPVTGIRILPFQKTFPTKTKFKNSLFCFLKEFKLHSWTLHSLD